MENTSGSAEFTPGASDADLSARVLAQVSRLLKTPVETALDLAVATRNGMGPEMIAALVDSGLTRREVEWIVPSRTLSHRRHSGRPLTVHETGCLVRTVKIRAMAEVVMGSPEGALAWLRKPRRSFGGTSAMELLQTEVGGQVVEDALGRIDEGYFA